MDSIRILGSGSATTATWNPQPDISAFEIATLRQVLANGTLSAAEWERLGDMRRHFQIRDARAAP